MTATTHYTRESLQSRFGRSRESFGFGVSHVTTDFQTTLPGGLRVVATAYNTEELCCSLHVSSSDYRDVQGLPGGGFIPGRGWFTCLHLTTAEMLELCPDSAEWLDAAIAACKSDCRKHHTAYHPDMLAGGDM